MKHMHNTSRRQATARYPHATFGVWEKRMPSLKWVVAGGPFGSLVERKQEGQQSPRGNT